MIDINTILLLNQYENRLLELIENQLRNNEESLTQSDLQGAISAIVRDIYSKGGEKICKRNE